ncbi:MAG: S8 family serine peptidase, partial [Candidatus Poribacteria bacterium]
MTSKTRTSSTFVWPIMVFILFTGEVTKAQESYQEGVMLLKFTENAMPQLNIRIVGGILETGLSSLDELHRQHQALWLERLFAPAGKFEVRHVQYGLQRWYKMTFSESTEVEELIELYRADSNIASVQLNRKYELFDEDKDRAQIRSAGLPNDPFFANQWHLHNTGQTGGTPDADIDAPEAWDIQSGDPSVIVSVMDTGQDLDHPDLVDNLWVNAGEIPNNGIDDDNNGFIDDINGWDHSDDDNDPDDYHGHGSHTAGTIAAKTNNGIGVAGVAGGFSPGVKIMSNKIFPSAFSDRISLGFHYAADNGAVISSNSWGNDAPGPPDPIIEEAIDYFIANAGSGPQTIAGGVVVFAAGNDNTNDPTWGYPASYAPVIGVAGTNHNDIKASFSNWGTWVDVSAPGVSVYSLLIGGYGFLSGTSMACPHVAGVAALIASQNPDFTAAEVRAQLEATTDNIDDKNPGFEGLLGTGRVNAFTAVGPTLTVPKPPENLLALLTDNDVNLTWNDPTENTDDSPLTDLDHINVYRNGALIAEIAPGVESYDDLDLGNGVYDYFATAVDAEDTQSSPSNTETVIIGQIDALILAPPGVFSAQEIVERAEQVKGQSLTLQQAQSMLDARLQSHSQIEAALTANGIASLTTQDITNFNLFDFQYLFVILG